MYALSLQQICPKLTSSRQALTCCVTKELCMQISWRITDLRWRGYTRIQLYTDAGPLMSSLTSNIDKTFPSSSKKNYNWLFVWEMTRTISTFIRMRKLIEKKDKTKLLVISYLMGNQRENWEIIVVWMVHWMHAAWIPSQLFVKTLIDSIEKYRPKRSK